MIGYDRDAACHKAARTIAIEADAISACQQFPYNCDTSIQLDAQILAYRIGAQRIRAGQLSFEQAELHAALEHVMEEARLEAIGGYRHQAA